MIFEDRNWVVRDYSQWLLKIIHGYDVRYAFYGSLLDILWTMEFVDRSGLDEDRVRDALALRDEYASVIGNHYICEWGCPCTVLEMLVGIAQRCDAIVGTPEYPVVHEYFWKFIDNLGYLDIWTVAKVISVLIMCVRLSVFGSIGCMIATDLVVFSLSESQLLIRERCRCGFKCALT